MKIRIFEGNKGDCLQVTSAGGTNILVDGGLVKERFGKVSSYADNVAPELTKMRDRDEKLDLVCVSHVDQDHIGGILAMLNDEFDWRVHDHQRAQGLSTTPPQTPRAPEITQIWHNSFAEQIGRASASLETALRSAAARSIASGSGPTMHGNDLFGQLANSLKEGAQLSRRMGAAQLNIPLNPQFNGDLVRRHNQLAPINIGDLKVTVLGPTPSRLKDFKEKWDKWLKSESGKRQIKEVRRDAARDERVLIEEGLASYFQLDDLGPSIGNRGSVSEQNVASIMMMVEENGTRVLFTGDGRDDHIYEDLKATGFADNNGHVHVDVMKVSHHGSESNWSLKFGQKVTADHYLLCGNGAHGNPDLRMLGSLLDARIGTARKRSPHIDPDRPFKLWFTSDGTTNKAKKKHMEKVVKLVERRIAGHSNASVHFSNSAFFDLDL